MGRCRHKIVFLILISGAWMFLSAAGQYNEGDIVQIKCCDNDDKSNGMPIDSQNSDADIRSTDLPIHFERFRLIATTTTTKQIPMPSSSSCIPISLESQLTADQTGWLSALKIAATEQNQSDENKTENSPHKYVVYCTNATMTTNIDNFISKSINDKSASNGHSDVEVFSGIILTNVNIPTAESMRNRLPTNHGNHANANNERNQLTVDAAEYLSWTRSHLTSESFGVWIQQQQQEFVHLIHLDLSENNITNLAAPMFDGLPNLKALNLSQNAIRNEHFHPQIFHRFNQLQQLDLSHNKIMSIVYERLYGTSARVSSDASIHVNSIKSSAPVAAPPPPPPQFGVFANMPELRELILSHNQINDLPRNTFAPDGLPNLHYLNLAHNNLSIIPYQFFENLTALQSLDVSANHLMSILDNFFIDNGALVVLNLRQNSLVKVLKDSFNGLHQLIELDLSLNKIEYIDRSAFDSLKALQRLNLCMNNLAMLPTTLFYGLHKLKYLNLSQNKFKTLPNGVFAHQLALEQLYIDETGLQKLSNWVSRKVDGMSKEVLKRLRTISIRRNHQLREIDAIFFRNLPAVEQFNLSENSLKILPAEIGELTELKHLDISKNDLISIPKQLNTLQKLDSISLMGNSYQCDCHMVWLTAWINETRTRVINSTLLEQQPPFNQMHELKCRDGYPGDFLRVLQQLQCYKPTAVHVSESKTHLLRSDALIECSFRGNPVPDIIWVTPLNKIIPFYADPDAKPLIKNATMGNGSNADFDHLAKNREKMEHQILKHKHINFSVPIGANEVTLLENGSLRVHNISRKDSGRYLCYGYNAMGFTTAEIR